MQIEVGRRTTNDEQSNKIAPFSRRTPKTAILVTLAAVHGLKQVALGPLSPFANGAQGQVPVYASAMCCQ